MDVVDTSIGPFADALCAGEGEPGRRNPIAMTRSTDQGPKSLYAQVLIEDIFDALGTSRALGDDEIIAILERIRDLLRSADGEAGKGAVIASERALLMMRKPRDD